MRCTTWNTSANPPQISNSIKATAQNAAAKCLAVMPCNSRRAIGAASMDLNTLFASFITPTPYIDLRTTIPAR